MKEKRKRNKIPVRNDTHVAPGVHVIPLLLLFIAIAGLLAYLNSFTAPFVFDDLNNILDNPTIRSLKNIKQVFSPPVGSGVGDRPVVNFTLALNYAVSDYRVWSYHALNLLVHIMAALTLFGIVRLTLAYGKLKEAYGNITTPVAFAVALIWTLHPIQTQAVTYIIQRCESIMALFFLLTIYCAIKSWHSPSMTLWRTLSVVFFLLGVGSKEVIIMAPVIVFAYEWHFIRPSIKDVLTSSWPLYSGYLAGSIMLFLLVYHGGTTKTGFSGTFYTPWLYWLSQPEVILHYLRLVIWPDKLCFDYSWPLASFREALPSLAVVTPAAAISVWLFFKRSPFGFLALCFFLILLPTSVIPLPDPAAEYRMYLPLAPLSLIAVTGAYRSIMVLQKRYSLFFKESRLQKFCVVFLLLIGLVLGALTCKRNHVYQSEITLWEDTVRKRPMNAKAQLNLGMANFNRGKTNEAIVHFLEAIRLRPEHPDAYSNMGGALLKINKGEEALYYFQKGLTMNPNEKTAAWLHSNMGVALFGLGRQEDAISHFQTAILLKPEQAEYYANLGLVLERTNRLPEAAEAWEHALKINPGLPGIRERLTAVQQKKRAGR